LHAGLKYLRPMDYLEGNVETRLAERKNKLKKAAERRRQENLKRFCERNDKEQVGGVALKPPGFIALEAMPTDAEKSSNTRRRILPPSALGFLPRRAYPPRVS